MMKISNLKDKLVTCGIFLIILAAYIAFDLPCFFRHLFDIPCPGCGMTRAVISALHLDFQKAFEFHSMFWATPVLVLYYFADWRLFKRKWLNEGILELIGVGFLGNWIVHLFN